jgi:tetratricopeptide (TPR) repeat protein
VIEHGRYELANDMVMGLYHIALMEGRYREMGQRFEWAILCLQKAGAKGVSETDHELAGLLLALLLFVQGDMCLQLGLLSQVQAHIAQSHELLDAITPGWRRDEYTFFTNTLETRLRAEQGDFAQALRLGRKELACLRETDVRVWPHVPEVGTLFMEANTCQRLAYVSWYTGQYDVARDWLEESLAIRERLGEERYRAHGLRLLADLLRVMGETEEAERLATQGQVLSEAHRDRSGIGSGHVALGSILLATGRSDEARARFGEGLAMARENGNHGIIVTALNGLGAVALACGDFEEAGRCYEESRASFERLEIFGTLDYASSVIGLGNVALACHDPARARTHFREALTAPACAAWEKMDAIAGMAEVFAQQGDPDCAARLFALVADHPFTAHETRQRAVRRLAEVESGLLAEREHSAPRLDDVVRELIAADRLGQALE